MAQAEPSAEAEDGIRNQDFIEQNHYTGNMVPWMNWMPNTNKSVSTLVVGSGLVSGFANVWNKFHVDLNGIGIETMFFTIRGPGDAKAVSKNQHGLMYVSYIVPNAGTYYIDLRFGGRSIGDSPFVVQIAPYESDSRKVKAEGPGLKSCKAGEVAKFFVNTKEAGRGVLTAEVVGPQKCPIVTTTLEATHLVKYLACLPGWYEIHVRYDGIHILLSPFLVECIDQPYVPSKNPDIGRTPDHEDDTKMVTNDESNNNGNAVSEAGINVVEPTAEDEDDGEENIVITWIPGPESANRKFWMSTSNLPS